MGGPKHEVIMIGPGGMVGTGGGRRGGRGRAEVGGRGGRGETPSWRNPDPPREGIHQEQPSPRRMASMRSRKKISRECQLKVSHRQDELTNTHERNPTTSSILEEKKGKVKIVSQIRLVFLLLRSHPWLHREATEQDAYDHTLNVWESKQRGSCFDYSFCQQFKHGGFSQLTVSRYLYRKVPLLCRDLNDPMVDTYFLFTTQRVEMIPHYYEKVYALLRGRSPPI